MVVAFATLEEAWGPAPGGPAQPVARAGKQRTKSSSAKQGGSAARCSSASLNSKSVAAARQSQQRVLENIMDVYTSDKALSEVSASCKYAAFPPPEDLLLASAGGIGGDGDGDGDYGSFVELGRAGEPGEEDACDVAAAAKDARLIAAPQVAEPFVNPPPPAEQQERKPPAVLKSPGGAGGPRADVYALEMLMYIASGILLIFMMEQLLKLGTSIRAR